MTEKTTTNINPKQKLVLEDRKSLSLNGVEDVESFSDKEVILNTKLGKLTIKGEMLKISKLNVDVGEFCIGGYIISLVYSKSTQSGKGSFMERILK